MPPLLVTAAIIRCEDRILLTRRPPHVRLGGWWEFPGGKLDEEESPQEGLRREIIEELGIEIEVGPIFEVVYYRYERGPVLIMAYECRQCDDRPIRNIEVCDHRWILPTQLDQFEILPADQPIVEKLRISAIPGSEGQYAITDF
ncbi:MAG: NUDIX domain-containing protein [Thermodesulfobacteriota bacterium]|jgi:8-oxo-dGTP diphosphatase|nr:NUDIX domain-containing protein [Thermodesulfobacteriota bacterium]